MKYDPINYQVIAKFGWSSFVTVYLYIVLFLNMNLLTANHVLIMMSGEYRSVPSRMLQTCNLLWKYISMGNTQNGIRLRAIKWLQENIGLNIFSPIWLQHPSNAILTCRQMVSFLTNFEKLWAWIIIQKQ